jgi:hypothetical protein
LFGPLKEALGGHRFQSDDRVEEFVRNWAVTRPPTFYEKGIQKLPHMLAKMCRTSGRLCRKKVNLFCIFILKKKKKKKKKTRGVVGHPVGTKFLSLYILY